MSKRFTATEKWKDVWFQELPAKYKLFWLYLLDECDTAGIWRPNINLASFQIGEPFESSELQRIFKDRIQILESGYWFISKFIEFQYGKLSPESKPHQTVIKILTKNGIPVDLKGIHTLKYKEEEKEQVMDKEKYIMVADKKISDVIPILDFYEAQLNGTMREHNNLAWRPIVGAWFSEHIGEDFKDAQHVKNSFKRFYLNQTPNKQTVKKQMTTKEILAQIQK